MSDCSVCPDHHSPWRLDRGRGGVACPSCFLKFLLPGFAGKTTLADSLVASNGIISQRQAGKVRCLV